MTLEQVVRKESKPKRIFRKVKENVKRNRYLQNYPNDILAGNVSRTPLYAGIDMLVLGVEPEKAIYSVAKGFAISACGWSITYNLGNSLLPEFFTNAYKKYPKTVENIYSGIATFGFGMVVSLLAGYDFEKALVSSLIRAAMGTPLGAPTRWYTNSLRAIRGEPNITKPPLDDLPVTESSLIKKDRPLYDRLVNYAHSISDVVSETVSDLKSDVYDAMPGLKKISLPSFPSFENKPFLYSAPRIAAMILLPLAFMTGSFYLKDSTNTFFKSVTDTELSAQIRSNYDSQLDASHHNIVDIFYSGFTGFFKHN